MSGVLIFHGGFLL